MPPKAPPNVRSNCEYTSRVRAATSGLARVRAATSGHQHRFDGVRQRFLPRPRVEYNLVVLAVGLPTEVQGLLVSPPARLDVLGLLVKHLVEIGGSPWAPWVGAPWMLQLVAPRRLTFVAAGGCDATRHACPVHRVDIVARAVHRVAITREGT